MEEHFQFCLDQLKDNEVYSAILYLPKHTRNHASVIYAFVNELEKIPNLVKEPMAGEVRMQWWQEVVEGKRADEALANPISQALNDTIETLSLPREGFSRFIEAKLFDLYNDPMPDIETLEAYLGETESFILQMISMCVGADSDSNLADACGHGGVAIGVANLLRALPEHTNAQKIYLPQTLLSPHELSSTHWLAADFKDHHRKASQAFSKFGLEHYKKFVNAIGQLPKEHKSVFLPLAIARKHLIKANSFTKDPRQQALEISPLAKQFTLAKTAMFGFTDR